MISLYVFLFGHLTESQHYLTIFQLIPLALPRKYPESYKTTFHFIFYVSNNCTN